MDEPLLRQNPENFLNVVLSELLADTEGQLERGAFDVVDENMQVVRIDERALRRRVEEVRWVSDDELIDRRARCDHDRGRAARSSPGTSGTLPRCRNRARVPGHDAHVESADVDPELERVGRHHRAHRPFPQTFFNFPAPLRQIAAAIPANRGGRVRGRVSA